MELTDDQLEVIREAARTVDYGSVTINVSPTADRLDLDVRRRIRIDKEPTADKPAEKPAERRKPRLLTVALPAAKTAR